MNPFNTPSHDPKESFIRQVKEEAAMQNARQLVNVSVPSRFRVAPTRFLSPPNATLTVSTESQPALL